jgi:hypothetical protein
MKSYTVRSKTDREGKERMNSRLILNLNQFHADHFFNES